MVFLFYFFAAHGCTKEPPSPSTSWCHLAGAIKPLKGLTAAFYNIQITSHPAYLKMFKVTLFKLLFYKCPVVCSYVL